MKKTELQSIIREEIQNFLSEELYNGDQGPKDGKYTWDVTQLRSVHRWSNVSHSLPLKSDVAEWKKGHTVTVKADHYSQALDRALSTIWGVYGKKHWRGEHPRAPREMFLEDLIVNVKKR